MTLLKKIFKKNDTKKVEEKAKGKGCCSFNLDDEISKAKKEEKKGGCGCGFDLDKEIKKASK